MKYEKIEEENGFKNHHLLLDSTTANTTESKEDAPAAVQRVSFGFIQTNDPLVLLSPTERDCLLRDEEIKKLYREVELKQ